MNKQKEKVIEVFNNELSKFETMPELYSIISNIGNALANALSDEKPPKRFNEPQITRVDDLRTKITPALIISHQTLRDVSLWQLVNSKKNLDYYENLFKEQVNYGWANSHQYFSDSRGFLYQFLLSIIGIDVWATSGTRLIYSKSFKPPEDTGNYASPIYDFVMPREVYDEMMKAVDDYAKGKIRCSKCDKSILQTEVAGTFYAGSYCADCWENGVKQAEARENYD